MASESNLAAAPNGNWARITAFRVASEAPGFELGKGWKAVSHVIFLALVVPATIWGGSLKAGSGATTG
jgi:hypothetical protein